VPPVQEDYVSILIRYVCSRPSIQKQMPKDGIGFTMIAIVWLTSCTRNALAFVLHKAEELVAARYTDRADVRADAACHRSCRMM